MQNTQPLCSGYMDKNREIAISVFLQKYLQ